MDKRNITAAAFRRTHLGIGPAMFNLVFAVALLMAGAFAASARDRAAGPIRIVAFGDSLTAGFGLRPGEAFPDVLQRALVQRGRNVEVVNAGVSGDTTAAGLARLDWAIGADADGVIVELGANDALRGQAPLETRANLDAILERIGKRKLPVLIAGMRSPSNWGEAYRTAFDAISPTSPPSMARSCTRSFSTGSQQTPSSTSTTDCTPMPAGSSRSSRISCPRLRS